MSLARRLYGLAGALLLGATAEAAPLPRLASMNVCTDQLLMALADPGQILGLSRYARDPSQSLAADAALRFPALSGGAEDILVMRPDVVLASQFDKRATRDLLKANGIRLAEFAVPETLAAARTELQQVGELTGHPERAASEVARIDAAVSRARQMKVGRPPVRVLALSRRGWVSGRDSLLGALLKEAGLVNVAGEIGITSGGLVSLEAILKLRPERLVVTEAGERAEDEGRAILMHPALAKFYPPEQRIVVPERLTVCGGGTLADALDLLVSQLEKR